MRDFDWRIVDTLKRTQNVTKAAQLLFITQPTLTRRIQLIEEELGFPLITRSSKGIRLTSEGEYVAQTAAYILEKIEAMRLGIADFAKGESGTLHLGVPTAYAMYVMPAFLEHFTARYPNVNLDIIIEHSVEIQHLVENHDLDVGFVRGEVYLESLEKVFISEDQVCIVADQPFALEDLATMPRIEFVREPTGVQLSELWWRENFSTPPVVRMKLNNCQQCLALVKRHLGYGIVADPKYIREEENLFVYPMRFRDGRPFTSKTWIVYHKDHLKNAILNNFLHFATTVDINEL